MSYAHDLSKKEIMKLQRNKKKLNTCNLRSINGMYREELCKWELSSLATLASGKSLGYEELAIYMYWMGSKFEETNSGFASNRIDGHEISTNRATSFLAKASQSRNNRLQFNSIGQLKRYANKSFKSAAMDAGRKNYMSLPWSNGKQALTLEEKKQWRVKRIMENPATGPHIVDVFMDSHSEFDSLEQQELKAKVKQILNDVLSECKQGKYAEALRLEMQGMKGPQIAAALGTSHDNARQLLCRAKAYVTKAILAQPDARSLIDQLLGGCNYDRCEIDAHHVSVANSCVVDLLNEQADEKYSLCTVA